MRKAWTKVALVAPQLTDDAQGCLQALYTQDTKEHIEHKVPAQALPQPPDREGSEILYT